MMAWLSGLEIGRKAALGIFGAFVLILAIVAINKFISSSFDAAEGKGAAEAQMAGTQTTIEQIGAANDAGEQIRAGAGDAKYCECVRSARAGTAGNCQRYLADKSVLGGQFDPAKYCS